MRRSLMLVGVAGFLLLGAAPAAPPDAPVSYIGVDELKLRLDRGERAEVIDVRTWQEYRELHIKGARSIPLRAVEERAQEVSQSGLVVFY
ncbi:MAG TPA: rhodanese-like domain-containing protein [bacterium]|nr:rhodanese-like domain-containing protein [bacterium]